ncbi:uncharacterized protein EDB91DRAFT_1253948 [Suillus paluster]|uniref:uncharacterized protein n=1 Tax=Suillus paluster TaxID=48578 RepID=UPI001B886DBA|nr:uncharacterized protein EDB91DRAFT_1253948 [Suillus paluster]KAG1727254.1 hypothetical protein EDB91DRAFT_1253948 [Suillus paluster]
MSNRPQMSLEHARQDMTGAYPMQGQIQGASQPKQSPLADLGRNGSHVDVGLSGIQRREQSMGPDPTFPSFQEQLDHAAPD